MGISPNRVFTENLISEIYDDLHSEEYNMTIASENHNKEPSSKTVDKIILCENYTDVDKETKGKRQLIMAATLGVQFDERAKPYL
jgi:hypothetical protein